MASFQGKTDNFISHGCGKSKSEHLWAIKYTLEEKEQ